MGSPYWGKLGSNGVQFPCLTNKRNLSKQSGKLNEETLTWAGKIFSTFLIPQYKYTTMQHTKSAWFWQNGCQTKKLSDKAEQYTNLACSESNASTKVGSYLDRPHPRLWSWYSCIPPSPRWNLIEEINSLHVKVYFNTDKPKFHPTGSTHKL